MTEPLAHHRHPADVHRVPKPFRSLAVRCEQPSHADRARAPYRSVHQLTLGGLDAATLQALAAPGHARLRVEACSAVAHARTTPAELAAAAPQAPDLMARIAAALQASGVLGESPAAAEQALATRIDHLAARGAGFHNDVARHWPRCLFWLLALDVADAEFLMPHAGLRLPLAPGELLVFDPTMAHGLGRPADAGQVVPESFEGPAHRQQIFLTGELLLSDARWAALGSPWLPLAEHASGGALDLMVASFDERSGAVQRPLALRDARRFTPP